MQAEFFGIFVAFLVCSKRFMSHLYVKRELTQKFKARTVPKLETSDVKTQLTFFMKQHVAGHRVRGGVYGTCA